MAEVYECTHSAVDRQLHLLFHAGTFESLPYEVRMLSVWAGRSFGEMSDLRPAFRSELAQHGYVVVSGQYTTGVESSAS
jgi:hypothetical protein